MDHVKDNDPLQLMASCNCQCSRSSSSVIMLNVIGHYRGMVRNKDVHKIGQTLFGYPVKVWKEQLTCKASDHNL